MGLGIRVWDGKRNPRSRGRKLWSEEKVSFSSRVLKWFIWVEVRENEIAISATRRDDKKRNFNFEEEWVLILLLTWDSMKDWNQHR